MTGKSVMQNDHYAGMMKVNGILMSDASVVLKYSPQMNRDHRVY
jgi:hypothetical protein